MFCKKINLLILTLVLVGCSAAPKQIEEEPKAELPTYGVWTKNNCQLSAKMADIKVTLTDIYAEGKSRILIQSDVALKNPPQFKVWGLEGYSFNIAGYGTTYSLEVPTTALAQARMHLNQAFLQIRYQVKGTDYFRRAIFNMQELPKAMLDIQKECM